MATDEPTPVNPHATTPAEYPAYNIAWVCTSERELEVADLMVDEIHEPVSLSSNGQIGNHGVVIIYIPPRGCGLLGSLGPFLSPFPNIRIGLMGGIASGAPRLGHDLRLGDVVAGVGIEESSRAGPAVFRPGARTLTLTWNHSHYGQQQQVGAQIKTQLADILARLPYQKRRKYSRPPVVSDRLYKPDFIHTDSLQSCSVVCGDEPERLVERPLRDASLDEDDESIIHHGAIQRSSTFVKSAQVRDAQAAEEGVLCFKVDTLDLKGFPCLIAVGICDYADSHKNDEWQNYATMMAAVYIKELLSVTSPNAIDEMEPVVLPPGPAGRLTYSTDLRNCCQCPDGVFLNTVTYVQCFNCGHVLNHVGGCPMVGYHKSSDLPSLAEQNH
ncbi:hypothetical protein F5X68DRAFT_268552 [Plectosphaerella plurivora]|uniref:Nucleoside phosphorylase domain-containing protein n=1 Tax=Plectosphaerella plurivora TaxID=936078 RepID=A0A9P8VCN6_9PEZI|nr:hypothetical protein F5X68DRAFT_268552 [Plectosphaerella plurivora]